MTRTLWNLAAAIVALPLLAAPAAAQQSGITATYLGTQETLAPKPRLFQVTPAAPSIQFYPTPVGTPVASAQTLTATFQINGNPGSPFAPTATLHYGLNYTVGTVACTGPTASQTCTVPVTFLPVYPGARKDALQFMNGTSVLATVFLGGIGQAPLALVQPGVVTQPIQNGANYFYKSIVGEDGTVYVVGSNSNTVYSITKAGVVTLLPITGLQSPNGIAVDGAGTLYIAQNTYSKQLITYTAAGVQGAITVVPPSPYVPCSNSNGGGLEYLYSVAVDQAGNLFVLELLCNQIFEVKNDGTYATTTINPSITQPGVLALDGADNLFIGGYTINELTAGGTQTQINSVGASDGLGVDAADTVYATRYTGANGVAELPASNYTTFEAALDSGSPLGTSVGPDGTLWVGNYTNVDKVDRSQGTIAFGEQSSGTSSTPQNITIYNGGNQPLTISNFVLNGAAFSLQTATTNPCSGDLLLAPGALCQVSVVMTPPHAGIFSGSLVFTTNSLNATASTQSVALSGFAYGVYVTPSPTSLTFASQTVGTSSATQTITLTNSGDLYSAGIGTPVSSSSAFTINNNGCSGGLGVGASCNLVVTFTPTAAVTYTNVSVTVGYSSSGGGPNQSLTFTLNGTGTPAPAPIISFSPTSIAFGAQATGTTSTAATVQVTNSGNAALNFTGITLTGANPPDFAISANTCGTTSLAPLATCTVSVTFTPALTASFAANLSFADNATGTPQTVALTGYAPQLVLSPNPLVFIPTPAGTPNGNTTVTLSNVGTTTVTGITTSIASSSFAFSKYNPTTTCGTTLAGGASCVIGLEFYPSAAGPYSGTLSVTDSAPGSPQTVPFTAQALAPLAGQVQFTPVQLNAIAGTGTSPTGCVNPAEPGPALQTQLCDPVAVAADTAGNVYFVEQTENVVKKIDTSGNLTTFAGTENAGPGSFTGDNGLATLANLSQPAGIAIDLFGNVYISDAGNGRIREVNTTTGVITTFVGGGSGAHFNGGTGTTVKLIPQGIAFDPSGNLYIAEPTEQLVIKVTSTGVATIFAGVQTTPGGPGIPGYNGESIQANTAQLNFPTSVASDRAGNIYIADSQNYRVRYVNENAVAGQMSTAAGTGVQGTSGAAINPLAIALNLAGDIFISDGMTIRKANGYTTNIPVVAGGGTGGLGGLATNALLAGVGQPGVDSNGNLLIPVATAPQILSAGPYGILQFGSQTVNTTSASQTITLENTGPVGLYFNQATYTATGDFTVTGGSCEGGFDGFNPGNTCTLIVTFTPSTTGSRTGTITVSTSANASPSTVLLQGTGAAPAVVQAVLTPSAVSFGNQAVNTASSPFTMVLTNPGTVAVSNIAISFSGANASAFTQSNNCGTTLAASSACNILVTFTPTTATAYSASINVADSATGSPQTSALTGTSTAPQVTLAPNPDAFPATPVGSQSNAPTPMSLTNNGTAPLTITSITITGANASSFSQTNLCPATLAAGASCGITVLFNPTAAGPLTANVSVTDNASGSPHTAVLTGTGTVPQLTFSPTSLSFGSQQVNTTSAPLSLTITNPGGAPLQIASGLVSGEFAEISTCSTTLAAGASCTLTFSFTPLATGTRTGSIVLTDNASGSPQTVVFTGTGTAAPAAQAVLSPSGLIFAGTTVATTSAAQTLTLSNPGNATLNIASIVLAGANPTAFSQTNNCGTALAASASCTISVTFTPGSVASFGATVLVSDNVTPQQSATLSGTGTAAPAPIATLGPATLTFPSTTVGVASGALPITLTNSGTAALTISSIAVTGTNSTSFTQSNNCGTSLAAGATCTISVVFTPASVATGITAAITVTDNAAGSPQSATITGTGTAVPVPIATLSPNPLNFPSTTIGTSASALPMTLTNSGTAALTISGIAVTGTNSSSFSQSNTCGTSLAAGAACTINVVFTPVTVAAGLTAAITVTDNAAGSPQSATITGTGATPPTSTFTVNTSTPSASVQPGAIATYNLTIAPLGGSYNNLVTLSASGLPAGATASFVPPAVTPGSAGAPSILSIQTPTLTGRLTNPDPRSSTPVPLLALLAGVPLLGLAATRRRLRRSTRRWMLLALAALAVLPVLAMTGCSGGYFGPAPQTYTVTVTGTSGTLQQSTTISLTVQ